MTIVIQLYAAVEGLLRDDDVIAPLRAWQSQGLKTALVTLVGVEGGAPRQAGAQMAVAENGEYAGYLSGGCLEAAVAQEARSVMQAGKNRIVRYGKGSPYFDVRLPCGSGLDLYFDQNISAELIGKMMVLRAQRRAFALTTSIATGESSIATDGTTVPLARSSLDGDTFTRVFAPSARLLVLGTGPGAVGIASLAKVIGLEIALWSPDQATRDQVANLGLPAHDGNDLLDATIDHLDFASAVVLAFHDHEIEPRILGKILGTDCFYIGVLGNHAVHRQRLEALKSLGFDTASRSRIKAPVGSIPAAKSKATLATGVVTEILDTAKTLNLVA